MQHSTDPPQLNQTPLISRYLKIYPNQVKIIDFKTPYSASAKPKNSQELKTTSTWLQTEEDKTENLQNSLDRTKTRMADLALCNDWETFASFTFNCSNCPTNCKNDPCICEPKTCNRFNVELQRERMSQWLENSQKRHGKFKYVIVMELHKKGSVHFHALLSGYKGKLTLSGRKTKSGRLIYNMNSFRMGFTTCTPIDNILGVSSYVRKYMTKDMPTFHGKKRYWCSTDLKRPIVVENPEDIQQYYEKYGDGKTYIPEQVILETKDGKPFIAKPTNIDKITTIQTPDSSEYEYLYAIHKNLEKLVKTQHEPEFIPDPFPLNSQRIPLASDIFV